MSRSEPVSSLLAVVSLLVATGCGRDLALPAEPAPAGTVAPLQISPETATSPPAGTVQLTARGGTPPYRFRCDPCPSEGAIDEATGAYTAGATGEVVDVIELADAAAGSARATVNVITALTVVPSAAVAFPGERIDFLVVGGKKPYTVAFAGRAQSAPGEEVLQDESNSSLVHYLAGVSGDAVDTFVITDAVGTTRSVAVEITASLAVDPPLSFLGVGDETILVGTGGAPPYSFLAPPWQLLTGSVVSPASGRVNAGRRAPGLDTVTVVDRLGQSREAKIQVYERYLETGGDVVGHALLDLDGDGRLDHVLADRETAQLRLLRIGAGEQLLEDLAVPVDLRGGVLVALAASDVTGPAGPDGRPDVVVVSGRVGPLLLHVFPGLAGPPWLGPPVVLVLDPVLDLADSGTLAFGAFSPDGADVVFATHGGEVHLVDVAPAGLTRIGASIRLEGEAILDVAVGELGTPDGLDDLALALFVGAEPGDVLVLRADAPGSFPVARRQHLRFEGVQSTNGVLTGDVDGDGLTDVVAQGAMGNFGVKAGSANGSFVDRAGISDPVTPADGLLLDLDGDGRDDMVTASREPGTLGAQLDHLDVYLSRQDGWLHTDSALLPDRSAQLAAAVDTLGRPAFAVNVANASHLILFHTDGGGRLGPGADQYRIYGTPERLLIGDLDGDPFPDLLVGDSDPRQSGWVLHGGPGRRFSAPAPLGGTEPTAGLVALAGDLDGDGRNDALFADASSVSSYLGTDLGLKPGLRGLLPTLTAADLALLSIDANPGPDLVISDMASGELTASFGDGRGKFGGARRLPAAGVVSLATVPGVEAVAALALRGLWVVTPDGAGSILVGPQRALEGGGYYLVNAVASGLPDAPSLLLHGGTHLGIVGPWAGTEPGAEDALPISGASLGDALADLDGDGTLDLVAAHPDDGVLVVHLGSAAGPARGSRVAYRIGGRPLIVRASDLDLDGLPDLVVLDTAAGAIRVVWGAAGGLPLPLAGGALAYGQPCGDRWACGGAGGGALDACLDEGGAERICRESCTPGGACPGTPGARCQTYDLNPSLGYCR